jgi:tetratricopeptide (TPR) repeat protein
LFSAGCGQQQQQRAVDLYVDAVMFRELNENEKAVEKLDAALKLNKRFSLAYSLLGETYQQLQDYEKSAASYEKAIELNPWSFKDYLSLGQVYDLTKKPQQALKAYAKASELKPDNLDSLIGAAKSCCEVEDYNNALVYARRAEQLDPNVTGIRKILGDVYTFQKDYDNAVAYYKRALDADSNNVEIMNSLALAYLRTGRYSIAKELLDSVIRLRPDNSTAYKHLGFCCLQLKDVNESVESYTRAIELDDKDWDSHRGLGVAYMLKGKNADGTIDQALKEQAISQWQLSLKINPDQPKGDKLLKLIQYYSKK